MLNGFLWEIVGCIPSASIAIKAAVREATVQEWSHPYLAAKCGTGVCGRLTWIHRSADDGHVIQIKQAVTTVGGADNTPRVRGFELEASVVGARPAGGGTPERQNKRVVNS